MKIQGLAIIFIIIIMPITIVLSEYVNNKITTSIKELDYDTKLLNSTYDSIKAYQINTVNNAFGDVTNSKISDIEAAVNTFYESLSNNFNYTGYKSEVMKEYVPAVVFTLYDGYYIYSPFSNNLTNVKDEDIDTEYSKKNEVTNGLKPYVYYSQRYVNLGKNWDFVITYTLDNYITIQGKVGFNNYVYDCGYLYSIESDDGIKHTKMGLLDKYIFDGIEFVETDTEELKEYVGDKIYSYTKINGKKYYLDENEEEKIGIMHNGLYREINTKARFFYIDANGNKDYNQVGSYESDTDNFIKYYCAIKFNKSAYMYYKRAYEFSTAVLKSNLSDIGGEYTPKSGEVQHTGYNLKELKLSDANSYNENESELKAAGITPLKDYENEEIFSGNIHLANSSFNKHRKAIIRYVIETNLAPAISGFSTSINNSLGLSATAKINYSMPKISETDWDIIENDVCQISFLQGLNLGSKKYNGYVVVANTLTKEYIDENDIYILTTDNVYCKPNDNELLNFSRIKQKIPGANLNSNSYAGIWKIDCEKRKGLNDSGNQIFYYPLFGYLGSYTSIMGNSGINEIGTSEKIDMYTYMKSTSSGYNYLKKVYYSALGRERWGSYNVNNINYELYGSNGNEFFLKDY